MSERWGSFVLDDASNQSITSENRHFVQHSENGLNHVVYVGDHYQDYCAAGGPTIYKGSSDAEVSLPAEITHLQSFVGSGAQMLLAAGLSLIGTVYIINSETLTRQLIIENSSIRSFDDILIVSESLGNWYNNDNSKDLKQDQSTS